jgi:6-phosphogluconolactonase (cycloisomerase 2 family)
MTHEVQAVSVSCWASEVRLLASGRTTGQRKPKSEARGPRPIRFVLWCLAVGLAIGLLGVPSALASADDSGRLRLVQVLEDGKDGVEGLYGAAVPAVSPDGANVYVTAYFADGLAVFARDAQSGRLTFLEAWRNGVNGVDGLGGANGVAVSPDGAHVYVASTWSSALTAFARNPLTGRLTFVQAQRDGMPGGSTSSTSARTVPTSM